MVLTHLLVFWSHILIQSPNFQIVNVISANVDASIHFKNSDVDGLFREHFEIPLDIFGKFVNVAVHVFYLCIPMRASVSFIDEQIDGKHIVAGSLDDVRHTWIVCKKVQNYANYIRKRKYNQDSSQDIL